MFNFSTYNHIFLYLGTHFNQHTQSEVIMTYQNLWGLKPKPKSGLLQMLKNRFLSFSVIISLGFLLLVSLSVNSLVDGVSDKIEMYFKNVTVIVFYIINFLVTFSVTTAIFAVIFKILPDAMIKWKDVFIGAIATAIFFPGIGMFPYVMIVSSPVFFSSNFHQKIWEGFSKTKSTSFISLNNLLFISAIFMRARQRQA